MIIFKKIFQKMHTKKNPTSYFGKLIDNNTGVSSKNFFLIVVTLIGCLLLLVPAFTLTFEVICMHTITTSLEGFASYIAADAGLFATAGITKAWSEKYEKQYNEHEIKEENIVKEIKE